MATALKTAERPQEMPRITTRAIHTRDLTDSLVEQWEKLESCALEPNAFLSPQFILPALRHLTPQSEPLFLLVEAHGAGGSRLVGLAVVEHAPGTMWFPLPHLRCFRTKHSFLDGLLVEPSCAQGAVEALFEFIARHRPRWHGLSFNRRSADSALATVMQRAADRLGMHWSCDALSTRPVCRVAEAAPHPFEQREMIRDRRLMKKRERLLKSNGFEFRVVRCGPEHAGCAETFLTLEAMGWKGAKRTALACQSNEAAFFRELISEFAATGRALFTEVVVDDRVVATTSNLISGRAVFGFKLGWNTDYAHLCPGKLNALEILLRGIYELPDLEFFDACTPQRSFVEDIWPARRTLTSGIFTFGRRASVTARLSSRITSWLRAVKRRLPMR